MSAVAIYYYNKIKSRGTQRVSKIKDCWYYMGEKSTSKFSFPYSVLINQC